ncbi:MAG: aminoglycoside phosphotransferase, partial [Bacteroidetes bacterium]|nr:aminoglycoside phosphotransferase [Bacteroidota bacterium]
MGKNTRNNVFSKLLDFLESSESYPHPVDKVEHIQTHISHVFIAGSFVYKLKKPVDFGFLDYSSLKKRKKYCQSEVELNRRLSDDIYLGVVGICRKNGHFNFQESNSGSDATIEYVVKMRKLNEAYFLNRIVEDGKLSNEHLDRVADTLTPFYLNQKQDGKLSKWGEVQTIKVNTDENFRQTEQFIGHTIPRNAYEAVRYFTNHYFQKNQQLFQRRIDGG